MIFRRLDPEIVIVALACIIIAIAAIFLALESSP